MVQRRSSQEGSGESPAPTPPEERKWRGTPLKDCSDEEIDTAINYCLGMLNALWTVRQGRKS